jgi:Zn-dependent peptidase ImmA (M78 family)/DNA-binding XRE family transcriptional regulator
MSNKVNPYMITTAREVRKLSQTKLSKLLKVTQATISKIEANILEVNEELLEKLSQELNFPKEFFYQKLGQAPDLTIRILLHRKRVSLKKAEETFIDGMSKIIDNNISKLLNSLDLDVNVPQNFTLDDYDTPSDIAINLRLYWKIPKGPIFNLTEVLEKAGIIIIELEIEDEKFDGVSFISSSGVPIILINKSLSPDRYRFTIAHELGHILMHQKPSPDCEDEANEFASEFLMPEKDIKNELSNLSFYNLPRLKQLWKVSMSALIVRADRLNQITPSRNKSLQVQISRAGWRKKEPLYGIPKEKPCLLKKLIDIHFKDLGYSKKDLCKYFAINEDLYNYLYSFDEEQNIRIKRLKRIK